MAAAVGGGVALEDVTNWLNAVLEFGGSTDLMYNGAVGDQPFRDWLSNGAVLLTVMNILCRPDKAKRVNKGTNPMATGSNFTLYKQGCTRKFNLNEDFDHDFLTRGGNISPMLKNISGLSYAVLNTPPPGYNVPPFGPQPKGELRHRTEAELRASRNAVPRAAQGDIAHASANNTDMAGIVKVKGTDRHSANAADLNYGSIAQSSDNNTDMAGIIKVKGTDRHNANANDLNYGALAVDRDNNTDMAGIIKVKGTDQHSANAADLNYGGIAVETGPRHDAVGVVRGPGLDGHSATAAAGQAPPSQAPGQFSTHTRIVK